MFGDIDVAFSDGLKEGRLFLDAEWLKYHFWVFLIAYSHLSGTVFTQKTVSLTVVEGNLSTFDEKSSVERQGIGINLDITTFGIGNENTSSTPASKRLNALLKDQTRCAYLSVAICSLAMDVKSSVLVAALKLVNGVLVELP